MFFIGFLSGLLKRVVGFSFVFSLLLVSSGSRALEFVGGEQYEVCRELYGTFLRGGEYNKTRYLVKNNGKFKHVGRQGVKKYNSYKLFIQAGSFRYRSIDKWKKRIASLEQLYKNESLEVGLLELDVNNSGTIDRVLEISWLEDGLWSYVSFPVDDNNNLDFRYFSRGVPDSIMGEIFLYDGRTFSVNKSDYSVFVYEYKPYSGGRGEGFVVTGDLCVFEKG